MVVAAAALLIEFDTTVGMTEDQIVAAGLTDAFDAQVRNPGTTNERFIRQLVQELR